jgi:hypothetical protein
VLTSIPGTLRGARASNVRGLAAALGAAAATGAAFALGATTGMSSSSKYEQDGRGWRWAKGRGAEEEGGREGGRVVGIRGMVMELDDESGQHWRGQGRGWLTTEEGEGVLRSVGHHESASLEGGESGRHQVSRCKNEHSDFGPS